jgi:hypothetical protein
MHAPFLKGFDMLANGILLAGGAAAGILMRQEKTYKDFDFFLVGHQCDNAALAAIANFANHVHTWHAGIWAERGEDKGSGAYSHSDTRMKVCRTRGCITFMVPIPDAQNAIQIQVILRHYAFACEVIRGFDLGSSAVSWDGARVAMTGLGKFAADHGANILNLAVRRASYERRLSRYFDRGYDLVLPDLDSSFTGRSYLSYLSLNSRDDNSCCLCHITAQDISPRDPDRRPRFTTDEKDEKDNEIKEEEFGGDRSMYENGSIEYDSPEFINANNGRALERALRTNGGAYVHNWLCAYEIYTPGMKFANMMPTLDETMWHNNVRDAFGYGHRVNLYKLKNLLGASTAANLLAGAMKQEGAGYHLGEFNIAPYCRERFLTLQAYLVPIPLEFRTVTDATALCGDSEITAREWYGDYYNDAPSSKKKVATRSSRD